MSQKLCVIWNTSAKDITPDNSDALVLDSPRAGGKYRITGSAVGMLSSLSIKQKVLLTSWLVDQRRSGTPVPEITTDTIKETQQRKPLRFSEKMDQILLATEAPPRRIGSHFGLTSDEVNQLIALTETEDDRELTALLRFMHKMGLIELGNGWFDLTFQGYQRLDNLRTLSVDSSQVFVAMWFDQSTDNAYRNGIYPAIEESGYKPFRIDNKEHVNKIDDEIVAEIRRSRFLVADFTCEPQKVRGGVYFEAGFAMGIHIPVIWTCAEWAVNDLHFDTRQYNHIIWKDPMDLHQRLKARIGAVIGDGPYFRS